MSKIMPSSYLSMPSDFPRASIVNDVFLNYQLCLDLVRYMVDEVKKEQVRYPLVPIVEIVKLHFDIARRFGWGCIPGEIEWIFQVVICELGCEMPESSTE